MPSSQRCQTQRIPASGSTHLLNVAFKHCNKLCAIVDNDKQQSERFPLQDCRLTGYWILTAVSEPSYLDCEWVVEPSSSIITTNKHWKVGQNTQERTDIEAICVGKK